jgi:hypothetical protein
MTVGALSGGVEARGHFRGRQRESRFKVLEEIRRLDPERDGQRIVFLTVYHEFPFEWLRATKIGLFKAFCSPEFSGTLARTGAVLQRTENRNDNTVVLFIGLMEYGYDSPEGRAALRFINRQHQPYPISEEAYRYTYAAIVMEPIRFVERFGWRPLDEHEQLAQFSFWREIARFMNVRHYVGRSRSCSASTKTSSAGSSGSPTPTTCWLGPSWICASASFRECSGAR